MSAPTATVLLPLYESHDIAWLAIESLCRQKTKHKWELIVAEEQRKNKCGESYFEPFLDRLKEAGMVRFVYVKLHKRIYLSEKWRMMSWLISPASKVALLQAADCYSEPQRINTALDAVEKGFDWVQNGQGIFYHIGMDISVLYDARTVKTRPKFRTHLNMAMRSDLMRHIGYQQKAKGVDGYLFNELTKVKKELERAPLKVFTDTNENWKHGVDTHGFNTISKGRGNKFQDLKWPFTETSLTIDNVVPNDIAARIKALASKLDTSKTAA